MPPDFEHTNFVGRVPPETLRLFDTFKRSLCAATLHRIPPAFWGRFAGQISRAHYRAAVHEVGKDLEKGRIAHIGGQNLVRWRRMRDEFIGTYDVELAIPLSIGEFESILCDMRSFMCYIGCNTFRGLGYVIDSVLTAFMYGPPTHNVTAVFRFSGPVEARRSELKIRGKGGFRGYHHIAES